MRTFDELTARLRLLRAWAGLGYHELHRRVVGLRRSRGVPERLSYNTVYRCLQAGRSRLDVELVLDIAQVLLGDATRAGEWRMAHQVAAGRATEADIVVAAGRIPDEFAGFVGRRAELGRILAALNGGGARAVGICGMAGVGKTRLAVHAGHHLLRQGHAGDLQLSMNLRGHDLGPPPADPAALLDALLRRLGLPGEEVYHLSLAGRTARYRQLLTGRRALILLDNAASEEQVRPLLPDSTTCLVLVTSRCALAGLPGIHHVRLDVFPAGEALELLRRTAGPERVDADPNTAARIASLVGYLPLALDLVATRIAQRPEWTLTDHLVRLTQRRRHRRLDDGVELALDTSYRALTSASRRMFRLLTLHPGGTFDAYAAAALAGIDLDAAQRSVDSLLTASLLHQRTPGRYSFHDLVAVYAVARAVDEERDSARHDALTRLFDHYLHTASQAMDTLYPRERDRRPRIAAPATPAPPVSDPAAARTWLDAEQPNLLAAVAHTAGLGAAVRAAGRLGDARGHHLKALAVANEIGDRFECARALDGLAHATWDANHSNQAEQYWQHALAAYADLGEPEADEVSAKLANLRTRSPPRD